LAADRKEFVKICQAVGVGFLIMGAVGYVVKLSKASFLIAMGYPWPNLAIVHIPLNNVLVGGA
jgi:protein transport protein SEC61 subunit gamma-like protein